MLLADDKEPVGILVRILNYILANPVFSNSDGIVFLSPLPPNAYDLRFEREGYIPMTLRGVQVEGGKVTEFDRVVLEPILEVYLPVYLKQ